METKPTRPVAPTNPLPGTSVGRDLARLKADGRATAAELREFVHKLRGRPAGEVLGLVTATGLFRATLTATLGTIVLMAVFTAGPYAWSKMFPKELSAAANTAAKTAGSGDVAKPSPDDSDTRNAKSADDTTARGNAVLDRMGESGIRQSDPQKNPLEESADDLLKDIK